MCVCQCKCVCVCEDWMWEGRGAGCGELTLGPVVTGGAGEPAAAGQPNPGGFRQCQDHQE